MIFKKETRYTTSLHARALERLLLEGEMPPHRTVTLTEEERTLLVDLRDHAPLPSLRERAAALLKIVAGMRPAVVARSGLLRPCAPDTVYDWLNRWLADGPDGLAIREGRGRKPAFPPSAPNARGGPGNGSAPGAT